ncbi:MAG: DUF2815 family protein [Ignavibacteriales bacterium]|nr:DUF2815 family protein [Ignavibacteriales bacterium]
MGAADAEAYYSADLLIPKDAKDTFLAINNAAKAAVERAVATKFNGKMPSLPSLQKPWSDGDAKDRYRRVLQARVGVSRRHRAQDQEQDPPASADPLA